MTLSEIYRRAAEDAFEGRNWFENNEYREAGKKLDFYMGERFGIHSTYTYLPKDREIDCLGLLLMSEIVK
jgi:hypothetical protein